MARIVMVISSSSEVSVCPGETVHFGDREPSGLRSASELCEPQAYLPCLFSLQSQMQLICKEPAHEYLLLRLLSFTVCQPDLWIAEVITSGFTLTYKFNMFEGEKLESWVVTWLCCQLAKWLWRSHISLDFTLIIRRKKGKCSDLQAPLYCSVLWFRS